jgi:hypothetical protein
MTNYENHSGANSSEDFGHHPLGEEYEFEELARTLGFSTEEIALANIRSYIENARREPAIVDVLGLPEEECGRCGMINVPAENLQYPCPHFHP